MATPDHKKITCRLCGERRLPFLDGGRACWGCMTKLAADHPIYREEVEGFNQRKAAYATRDSGKTE